MLHDRTDTPYGYCQCGCGEKTSLARQSNSKLGLVKGEPVRFLPGHASRVGLTARKRSQDRESSTFQCNTCAGSFEPTAYQRANGRYKCPRCVSQYNRKYRQENRDPEIDGERLKKWRRDNPERVREVRVKWNEHSREQRRRIFESSPVPAADLREIYERDKGRCVYCGQLVEHVRFEKFNPRGFDHVVPLSAGGAHKKTNLVVCCWPCNVAKSTGDSVDFRKREQIMTRCVKKDEGAH